MIGVALTEYLLAQGVNVYPIVRPDSKNALRLKPNEKLHVISGDLSTLEDLSIPVLKDAVFFHLGWDGAEKAKRNNANLQLNNVLWTISAVELAKQASCNHFIFAGSQAEYGRVAGVISEETPCKPETAYGIAKLCAESLSQLKCNEYKIIHSSARLFSVYGNYDGENTLISYLIKSINDGVKPLLTSCVQKWNYLYVKDAAKALYLIANKGQSNKIYNVASKDIRSLKSYVEELKDILDSKIEISFGEQQYDPKQVINLEVDLTQLEKDTSFYPSFSFKEGLTDMLNQ